MLVFGSVGGNARSGIRCFRVIGSVMDPMMGARGAGMDLESQRSPPPPPPPDRPLLFIAIGFDRWRRTAIGGDACRRDRRAADIPSDPGFWDPLPIVDGAAAADAPVVAAGALSVE